MKRWNQIKRFSCFFLSLSHSIASMSFERSLFAYLNPISILTSACASWRKEKIGNKAKRTCFWTFKLDKRFQSKFIAPSSKTVMCCTSQLKFSRSQAQVAKLARWNARLRFCSWGENGAGYSSVNRKYWHTRTTHKRKLVFLSLWPEGHRHDCFVCLCVDMRGWKRGRGCCVCTCTCACGANVSLNLNDAGAWEGVSARACVRECACVGVTWIEGNLS